MHLSANNFIKHYKDRYRENGAQTITRVTKTDIYVYTVCTSNMRQSWTSLRNDSYGANELHSKLQLKSDYIEVLKVTNYQSFL